MSGLWAPLDAVLPAHRVPGHLAPMLHAASVLTALFLSASVGVCPSDPSHVIGGDVSPTCAWPTTVSIGGCTGTLIHPEVVVYAAHCGDNVPSVWFGEQVFAGEGRAVPTAECFTNPAWELDGFQRHDD